MNRFFLTASLVERDALRYTPAGIPVVNCMLQHAGDVTEANTPRQIEFHIAAVAVGSIGQEVDRMPLGTMMEWEGFMARRHRNSKALVYHITGCKEFAKD
ncbi:MAG TPA: primosomal replication protein N [Burkholderiaceae bacterium]|uniref:primosomal replication protein N n=1 Tax=Imbroritus primus TaxID=3058603 RepID=UPI002C19EAAE|nr:primosomal replication protein N [Burkholderiaceae bacterium]